MINSRLKRSFSSVWAAHDMSIQEANRLLLPAARHETLGHGQRPGLSIRLWALAVDQRRIRRVGRNISIPPVVVVVPCRISLAVHRFVVGSRTEEVLSSSSPRDVQSQGDEVDRPSILRTVWRAHVKASLLGDQSLRAFFGGVGGSPAARLWPDSKD